MAKTSGGWEVWDDVGFDELEPEPRRSRVGRILAIVVVVAAVVGFGLHWARSQSNSPSTSGGSGAVGSPVPSTPGSPVVADSTVATTRAEIPATSSQQTTPATTVPAATVPTATVPAATVPVTTVPVTTVPAATVPVTTVPVTTVPVTTVPVTTVPVTTAPDSTVRVGGAVAAAHGAAVSTLQIVPALRGVVVDIDGHRFVSDADGTIQVPSARRHGVATIVGIADQPSLRRVGFLQWADGDLRMVRSLDALSGPVAQIGFTLSYRVVVQVPGDGPAVVRFTSEAGPVSLESGAAQWVPAAQAITAPGGLATEQFSYVVSSYERGGVNTPVAPQTFLSSPEALWRVS